MDKYSVADIITASLEDKPFDVNQFFYDLMADRTQEYVDAKREDIADKIFNSSEDDEEIEVVEVDDEDAEQLELDLDVDDDEEYLEDEEDLDDEETEDGEDA
jgi:hypothetical protein